ncbi:MAG: segregation/condensation protein A, partial [Defluviitaleaceae bacterium]|nr:segregation/condensation protein A [Defluviitaleaceae bacterium]
EGPMDLLLHLIEKNEIDIYDIPIAMLTEQYLHHLEHLREMKDMASISEFVVMAATLLEIKSRMLLPPKQRKSGEDEPDPRDELVNRLTEYMRYKKILSAFAEKELIGERYVFREPDTAARERAQADDASDLGAVLGGISLEQLLKICRETFNRREISAERPQTTVAVTPREIYTVEAQIEHIVDLLAKEPLLRFSRLFCNARSGESLCRTEIVVTFIAVLELAKQCRITLWQDSGFGEIMLRAS